MKTATLKIQRFDPEKDRRPYWAEYRVNVEANDRLLDALHKIKWEQDGSLTFRRSCGHGVCGSDAMSVNGLNRLACQLLMASRNSCAFWAGEESFVHRPQSDSEDAAYFNLPGARPIASISTCR